MKRQLYFEEVLETFCGEIIRSNIREATPKEIISARKSYKQTKKCKHNIIYDVAYYLYDARYCGICGKGLGLI